MKKLFLLTFYLGFLISCSHFPKYSKPQHEISHLVTPSHAINASDISDKSSATPAKPLYAPLPEEDHHKVDLWVRYFTGQGRELMQGYLERSTRYLTLMKAIIKKEGLPEELVYVALIESGFSSKAHSRANAVGYWQFIKSTGRRFGLRIDHFVDERRDPELSTRAAVEFFKELYSLFGSWHLALASYNAGEYRVNRAMMKHYSRNFWYLIKKKSLPSETSNYVPKFIAARRIAREPAKYGFSDLKYQENLQYDTVPVTHSISLKKLATHLKIEYENLKSLNPMYKGEYVPVYEKDTAIRIPTGLQANAAEAMKSSLMARPKYAYMDHYWYRVRRGDTLYRIARRNKTSLSNLRRANNMRGRSLIRVGQKIKVPTRKLAAVPIKSKKSQTKAVPKQHTVARGETLIKLSRRYGVSVAALKSLNNLKGSTIHPGQSLRLKANPVKSQSSKNKDSSVHVVRKGETLIGIADKYKISLVKLMKANSLNFKSILLTGTRLRIPQ